MDLFRDEGPSVGFSSAPRKRKKRHDQEYDDDFDEEPMDAADLPDSEQRYGDDGNPLDEEDEESAGASNFRRRTRHQSNTSSLGPRRSKRQGTKRPSSDDEASPEGPSHRGRHLRTRTSKSFGSQQRLAFSSRPDDDADELNADGTFHPVVSDLVVPSRAKKRRLLGNGTSSVNRPLRDLMETDAGSLRRSSRENKNTKSMAETLNVLNDDVLYVEEKAQIAPKALGMKEVFQTVGASDFKKAHADTCDTCGKDASQSQINHKGPLVYCQGCSLAFHKQCLGYRSAREHIVTKVGPQQFVLQCRFCIRVPKTKDDTAPKHDMCQTCRVPGVACRPFSAKKTTKQEEKARRDNDGEDPVTPVDAHLLNTAENVLFRCHGCHRAYHYDHLPAPNSQWADPEDVWAEGLSEYSIDWKCKECRDAVDKVGALVTWRPTVPFRAGQSFLNFDEDSKEYLVKWDQRSHAHCEWKPGAWVWGVVHPRIRHSFGRRNEKDQGMAASDGKDAIPEDYLLADIILAVRYHNPTGVHAKSKQADLDRIADVKEIKVKFQGLGYDEAVWDAPPTKDSNPRLWNAFSTAYQEFINGKHFRNDPYPIMLERIEEFRSQDFAKLGVQPPGLARGKLMDYQMEGLDWLLYNYYKAKSVILADEMGLGKTIQVIAMITSLVQQSPRCWPFLVVVPNSTCPNWRREIKAWSPELRVVTYHGGKESQRLAYEHELFPNGSRDMTAHVVIMSYDSAQDDATKRLFKSVRWAGLIVDEGQRLKNDENLLYGALLQMKIDFRLLLTGTPLQNNKRELFNLLQFVDRTKNAARLDEQYGEITADNLPELHQLIRPYFLRRTKVEVLKFLPSMAQIIVPVSLTVVQEKLCKSIMSKNPELIRAIFAKGKMKASERGSLNNILMQLRKCLCHPFLYSENVEERALDAEALHRNLVSASSKLVLLQMMLPKLQERGHRVLLFSQFLGQLDIVEDFLTGMGLSYQRLDGNMSSLEKQKRIDQFNAPDSALFAFLLSTRAGGVGINLATADTVIILDPDFNPHQDIQALSRAHRIGQKKKVLCFQFMTKTSVEEKIMQIGRKKMALDHALIESMDAPDDAGNDLESILKHGAEALFSDNDLDRITYDPATVDKLLDRSQVEDTRTDGEKTAASQFSLARVWAKGTLADDLDVAEETPEAAQAQLSVWDSIIRQREEEARRIAEQNKEVLGRGGRRRQAVTYTAKTLEGLDEGHDDGPGDGPAGSDYDGEYHGAGGDSAGESDGDDEEEDDDGCDGAGMGSRFQKRTQGTTPKKRAKAAPKSVKSTPKSASKRTPRPSKSSSRRTSAAVSSSSPATPRSGGRKKGIKPVPANPTMSQKSDSPLSTPRSTRSRTSTAPSPLPSPRLRPRPRPQLQPLSLLAPLSRKEKRKNKMLGKLEEYRDESAAEPQTELGSIQVGDPNMGVASQSPSVPKLSSPKAPSSPMPFQGSQALGAPGRPSSPRAQARPQSKLPSGKTSSVAPESSPITSNQGDGPAPLTPTPCPTEQAHSPVASGRPHHLSGNGSQDTSLQGIKKSPTIILDDSQ